MTDTIKERIEGDIMNNDIVLYMKGTADAPRCGFSGQVVTILNHLDVEFTDINVLDDDDLRQGIKDFSDWPTIPQVYVKGEFIGGCDILIEMFQANELQELLVEKGLMPAETDTEN